MKHGDEPGEISMLSTAKIHYQRRRFALVKNWLTSSMNTPREHFLVMVLSPVQLYFEVRGAWLYQVNTTSTSARSVSRSDRLIFSSSRDRSIRGFHLSDFAWFLIDIALFSFLVQFSAWAKNTIINCHDNRSSTSCSDDRGRRSQPSFISLKLIHHVQHDAFAPLLFL